MEGKEGGILERKGEGIEIKKRADKCSFINSADFFEGKNTKIRVQWTTQNNGRPKVREGFSFSLDPIHHKQAVVIRNSEGVFGGKKAKKAKAKKKKNTNFGQAPVPMG